MNDAAPAPPEGCPDEETISAFSRGELPAAQRAPIEAHIDQCDSCRNVVVELVRIFESVGDGRKRDGLVASGPSGPSADALHSEELAVTVGPDGLPPPEEPERTLRSGAIVGRYRVLECVGVGGMGVVYSAYDPELDRRVALKLLRGSADDRGSQGANSRLLREAQALARLTHPNVITVHDVGTWEEQVVVAMEFVDGRTLKTWLTESHTWPEVQEVFMAAGRGLAAAHAADLVHRDFKPDNVLLGKDGRVRVTDFGLARWEQPVGSVADDMATEDLPAADLRQSTSGSTPRPYSVEVSMTRTGTMVGTPAYMAPEQYERQLADAASDQFAFCVTLYQAIHGERPFKGRTLAELATNVLDGRLPSSAQGIVVPKSVRQAMRRGLSRQRADRFPNMEALLAELETRPRTVRWPWAIGVPAAVLAVGVWASATRQQGRSTFCEAERGLDGVWDASRTQALKTAFSATELAYAAGTADKAIAALDAYAHSWEAQRNAACEPKTSTAEGPALVALRTRCLDRGRLTLGALVEAFDVADAKTVARAIGAVSALPSPDDCSDRDQLLAELPPPPPPEIAEAVESVRDKLARGAGIIAAGHYVEGLALARRLDGESEALGHAPLRAETQYLLGRMLDLLGEPEAAVDAFEEAEVLAIASRHRRLVPQILTAEVYVFGESLRKTEHAMWLGRRAQAEVEASGLSDEARAALLLNLGTVALRSSDFAESERYMTEALAVQDRAKRPLAWADAILNLAGLRLMRGDLEAAIEGQLQYIEVFEAELGSMHPGVADGYHNLAMTYRNGGYFDKAQEAAERSVEIRELALGESHPEYARAIASLGTIRLYQGDAEEAVVHLRRAVKILDATEIDPVVTASLRIDLGDALLDLGRNTQAESLAREGIKTIEGRHGSNHPVLTEGLVILAWVAADNGDTAEVHRIMDRAERIWRDASKTQDDEARATLLRARILRRAGALNEARALLVPIWPIIRKEGSPGLQAQYATVVAELWADDPGRRTEAVAVLRAVIPTLRAAGMRRTAEVAQSWLDAHPER